MEAGNLICPPWLLTLYIYPTRAPKCLSHVENIHPEGLPIFFPASSAVATAIFVCSLHAVPARNLTTDPTPASEHTASLVSTPRSSVVHGYLGCPHRHRRRARRALLCPHPRLREALPKLFSIPIAAARGCGTLAAAEEISDETLMTAIDSNSELFPVAVSW
jgi:hypothetical protein